MSDRTLQSIVHHSTGGYSLARRIVLAVFVSVLLFYATSRIVADEPIADVPEVAPTEQVQPPASASIPASTPASCARS